MERIKLLTRKHKGYETIPSINLIENDNIALENEDEKAIKNKDSKYDDIIVRKNGMVRISYKCIIKMSNNGLFVIRNMRNKIDICKYANDHQKRLLNRYFVNKHNIGYIKMGEKLVDEHTEYELNIILMDGELIKGFFFANEAVEVYQFLRKCLKKWKVTIENEIESMESN